MMSRTFPRCSMWVRRFVFFFVGVGQNGVHREEEKEEKELAVLQQPHYSRNSGGAWM